MRSTGTAAAIAMLACLAGAPAGAEDDGEIDCASLKTVTIQNLAQYDYTYCAAHRSTGRSSGSYDGNVSSSDEAMVAITRATFVAMRVITAGRTTFFPIDDNRDFVANMLPDTPMRNWGAERRYGRFIVTPVEAQVTDDSPFLNCFAFLSKGAPAGLAPGYKSGLGGIYCAVDQLTPTDGEIETFLDDIHY